MEEKNLSEKEGLLLIQQMIQTAKAEQKDNGIGWIIWGWLLFFASIFSFLNAQVGFGVNQFFFWNMFGIVVIGLMLYEVYRYFFSKRVNRVKTYTQDLFDKLNVGFALCLMLIIFSMNFGAPLHNVPPTKGFALLLGLYGFWILIYGAALNFKPSIIGAFVTWGFAFASLFVNRFDGTMVLHALAVLGGYIIPGHIAYRQFSKLNRKETVQSV